MVDGWFVEWQRLGKRYEGRRSLNLMISIYGM